MRRVPRSVRVAGQVYDVRLVGGLKMKKDDVASASPDDEGQAAKNGGHLELLGLCNGNDRLILLDEHQNRADRMRETFIHESIHAMLNITGFDNDHTGNEEEAIVSRLAPVLLEYLRANPGAVDYLTTRD